MTGKEILMSDLLDIIFDKRNKSYGAYLLRRNYNQRLSFSLALALSSVLLLFFLLRPHGTNENTLTRPPDVVIRDFVVPAKPKIPELPASPTHTARTQAATQKFLTRINYVPDETKISATIPTQSDMTQSLPSTQSGRGAVPDGGSSSAPQVQHTAVTGNDIPAVIKVQKEPEFPGGAEAWKKYLGRNLRVPGNLVEGEQVTVLIRFQVDTDGTVTGFEVLRSGGKDYDNEVIRVLKKMPKWRPAIRDNQPVAWFYTQPVTFMGVAE